MQLGSRQQRCSRQMPPILAVTYGTLHFPFLLTDWSVDCLILTPQYCGSNAAKDFFSGLWPQRTRNYELTCFSAIKANRSVHFQQRELVLSFTRRFLNREIQPNMESKGLIPNPSYFLTSRFSFLRNEMYCAKFLSHYVRCLYLCHVMEPKPV